MSDRSAPDLTSSSYVDPEGTDVDFVPPPDYDGEWVEYQALRRADYCCESCGKRVELGNGLVWKIRSNDLSYRNTAYVCIECLHQPGWRDKVRERRVDEAGPVRRYFITWFWNVPTAAIRYAEHIFIGLLLLGGIVLATALVNSVDRLSTVVANSGWPLIGFVSGLYLCHLVVWVHRDPRGWIFSRRPPWHYLALLVGVGSISYVLASLVTIVPAFAPSTVLVGTGVGCAVLIDHAVRRDRSKYYLPESPWYRAIIVGTVRIGTFVAVSATVAPQTLSTPPVARPAIQGLPVVVSGGYLLYRSTQDPSARDRLFSVYNTCGQLGQQLRSGVLSPIRAWLQRDKNSGSEEKSRISGDQQTEGSEQ